MNKKDYGTYKAFLSQSSCIIKTSHDIYLPIPRVSSYILLVSIFLNIFNN